MFGDCRRRLEAAQIVYLARLTLSKQYSMFHSFFTYIAIILWMKTPEFQLFE